MNDAAPTGARIPVAPTTASSIAARPSPLAWHAQTSNGRPPLGGRFVGCRDRAAVASKAAAAAPAPDERGPLGFAEERIARPRGPERVAAPRASKRACPPGRAARRMGAPPAKPECVYPHGSSAPRVVQEGRLLKRPIGERHGGERVCERPTSPAFGRVHGDLRSRPRPVA